MHEHHQINENGVRIAVLQIWFLLKKLLFLNWMNLEILC